MIDDDRFGKLSQSHVLLREQLLPCRAEGAHVGDLGTGAGLEGVQRADAQGPPG
jgi:16S rRNA G527 N7-methylase RsmG